MQKICKTRCGGLPISSLCGPPLEQILPYWIPQDVENEIFFNEEEDIVLWNKFCLFARFNCQFDGFLPFLMKILKQHSLYPLASLLSEELSKQFSEFCLPRLILKLTSWNTINVPCSRTTIVEPLNVGACVLQNLFIIWYNTHLGKDVFEFEIIPEYSAMVITILF